VDYMHETAWRLKYVDYMHGTAWRLKHANCMETEACRLRIIREHSTLKYLHQESAIYLCMTHVQEDVHYKTRFGGTH